MKILKKYWWLLLLLFFVKRDKNEGQESLEVNEHKDVAPEKNSLVQTNVDPESFERKFDLDVDDSNNDATIDELKKSVDFVAFNHDDRIIEVNPSYFPLYSDNLDFEMRTDILETKKGFL